MKSIQNLESQVTQMQKALNRKSPNIVILHPKIMVKPLQTKTVSRTKTEMLFPCAVFEEKI